MARRRTAIGTLFARNPLITTGLVVGVGFLAFFGLKKLFAPKLPPRPRIVGG